MFYYMIRNRLVKNKVIYKLFNLILPHFEFTIKRSNTGQECELTKVDVQYLDYYQEYSYI